jgi:hypothetical protein
MKHPSRRTAAPATAAAVMALASVIAAGEQMPSPGARIWIADITIDRNGSGARTVDDSTPQRTHTRSATHKTKEVVKIKACGAGADLYVTEAHRTISESTHEESVDEFVQASCWPEEAKGHTQLYVRSKLKPEIKRPGDSSRTTEDSSWGIHPRSDNPPPNKLAHVQLVRTAPDTYMLMAKYEDYIDLTQDTVTKKKTACTGATATRKAITRFAEMSAQPGVKISRGGDSTNKSDLFEATLPPILSPRILATTVVLDRNRVSDSTRIGEIKPTPSNDEYTETTTGFWSLTVKDACDDVYDSLLQGLAFGEAYADPTIQRSAKSVPEYEAATCARAWEIKHGHKPPAGEEPCVDAGVTDVSTGEVTGDQKLREELARSCRPLVIADGGAAHEKTHQKQRKILGPKMESGDLAVRGMMERQAYARGSEVLLSWLKANCPGRNLSAEEARLEKLKRTSW